MSKKNTREFIIKWYSVFFHPSYFIRKGLYNSIKDIAPLLNGKLLDFGCGSKPYKQLFTNTTTYIGIDIEVSGHSHKDEQIDVYYDGKTIPFEDNFFEHVFATEVFEHVFNIDDVLTEINRVLKPGGYLLITCPFVWPEHEKPYDFARYTSFGIKYLFENHDFQIKDQRKTGSYFEAMAQLTISYINYFLPKRPYLLYLILFQIFILPIILITSALCKILPKRIKRNDLYMSNIVLAVKL